MAIYSSAIYMPTIKKWQGEIRIKVLLKVEICSTSKCNYVQTWLSVLNQRTPTHLCKFLIFRGSLLWNNLSISIKISQSLTDFKNNLRQFGKTSLYMCSVPLIICKLIDFNWECLSIHNLFLYIDFLLDCINLFKLVYKLWITVNKDNE